MLIIQMTGLSDPGKSSLAFLLKDLLAEKGLAVQVIDGDRYRKTICRDLDSQLMIAAKISAGLGELPTNIVKMEL